MSIFTIRKFSEFSKFEDYRIQGFLEDTIKDDEKMMKSYSYGVGIKEHLPCRAIISHINNDRCKLISILSLLFLVHSSKA